MVNQILKRGVRFYQLLLSPWIGGHCRFYPSCSEYTLEVLQKCRWWEGIYLGLKRILKCHPFHSGGIDLP